MSLQTSSGRPSQALPLSGCGFQVAGALDASGFSAPAENHAQLAAAARQMEPIRLDEMQAISLLDRDDTKFLLTEEAASEIAERLAPHYRALETGDGRLSVYRTLYFDTPDMQLYRLHHSGIRSRYKVRSRQYVESGQAFLEVKRKTNKGRTIKTRVPTPQLITEIDPTLERFLPTELSEPCSLQPVLLVEFIRLTLASRKEIERVTLDLGLRFIAPNKWVELPGMAIVEVKQAGYNRHSPVMHEMRADRILATNFSKYCLGVSLLYDDVKHNGFKPRLREIRKLTEVTNHG